MALSLHDRHTQRETFRRPERHPETAEPRRSSPAVRLIDPLVEAGWDARMAAGGAASFFHGTAWARVLQETYGYRPVYFTVGDRDRLECLLPFMEVNSWLTGRRGVALPFADECAPLAASAGDFGRAWAAALDHAAARGWAYLECRGGQGLFPAAPASTSFHGHRLRLAGGEEQLFARLSSATRRAVRKAEKAGVRVVFARGLAAMRTFYELQCRTRRRHGLPPQPWEFFASIQRHILAARQGWVVLARHGSVAVAGAVFFHAGTGALYKYAASDKRWQELRANDLVLWEAIRWYARQGIAQLQLGRTSLGQEGLRRFKLGWGAEEYRIDYVRFDRRAGGFVTVPDAVLGWHRRLCRALPLGCARLVGRVLYRHAA